MTVETQLPAYAIEVRISRDSIPPLWGLDFSLIQLCAPIFREKQLFTFRGVSAEPLHVMLKDLRYGRVLQLRPCCLDYDPPQTDEILGSKV